MAFGAELRDFVSSFQAGYNMFQSADEKAWEQEQRQMQRDDRQYRRDRDAKSDSERDEDQSYRRDRDAKGDDQWERQFKRLTEGDEFSRQRAARSDVIEERKLGVEEEDLRLRKKMLREKAREANRVPNEVDRFIEGDRENGQNPLYSPPDDTSDEQSAIPDDVEASIQPAAYSADNNTGFNLQDYLRSIRSAESAGNDRAKNPRSTASGRYQFIDSTWRGLANKYPELGLTDRFNGKQQERAIRQFTYDNAVELDKAGIPINNGNLYAAHFLGYDGAINALTSDDGLAMRYVVPAKVIKANRFLDNMTVGDFKSWVNKKGNRYSSAPAAVPDDEKNTLMMASGGLVEAIPEDPMAQQQMAEDELVSQHMIMPDDEEPEAIPSEMPPPSYSGVEQPTENVNTDAEAPSDDMWENARRAVREGVNKAVSDLRLDEETAVDDPEIEKAYENHMMGYGAAPDQIMRQVLDRVDPDRTRSPAERNMLAMGTVYRFYMDQGKTAEAQEAAKSMVQYYRTISNRFMSLAQAAAEEGELDDAAKAAVAAYANIPNGRDLDIKQTEKGFEVSVTDGKTGKQIVREIISPRDFAAMAMKFDPSTFDDELYNAAGVEPDKFTDASPEDLGKVAEDSEGRADTRWADGVTIETRRKDEDGNEITTPVTVQLTEQNARTLRSAATAIAGLKENQMTVDEALDFVNPSDTQRFTASPNRGNPDKVDVTKEDGTTVTMSKNAFIAFRKSREEIVKETARLAKEAADPGWLGKGGVIDKAAEVVKENAAPVGTAILDSEKETFDKNLKQFDDQTGIPSFIKRNYNEDVAIPDGTDAAPSEQLAPADAALMRAREEILASGDIEARRDDLDQIETELLDLGLITQRTPKK